MVPFSKICKATVKAVVPENEKKDESDEEEIILLAQKGAKEGTLTSAESNLVKNALQLDNITINSNMTPRTVVFALNESLSVKEVFDEHPNVPFARIPVFKETIDHICGMVRRRDLHNAMVKENSDETLHNLAKPVVFVPENATADKVLRLLLKKHCQLSVVVDEYGSVTGVLAMEDIIESILGQEIFEHDDLAVDMRELAKRKSTSMENGSQQDG